ncbi:MAG TPA: NFACT RNA binding domain-containing protein, partial [Blastocatellia bacterium]
TTTIKKQRSEKRVGRYFRSTDGYEIVVGRNDNENDQVTFRLARSTDIWLHAADYPGSHVIVRKIGREPIPQRAIIEAAQVAAFYSQAKRDSKVAVHYTEKKFVSKPPRSKPGLVRLSSFKTVLVEPVCSVEKIE